ncbi:MAG TPA: hypothetical protein VF479_01915 [Pseudolysinimonas sp.]
MSDLSHHTAAESRSAAPAVIAILLAVGAVALMLFSFVNGISAALDGSGDGAGIYVPLFFLGAAVAVAAAVIGIVGLVRRSHRILSSIAILISLIPGVGILLLRLANG